MADAGQSHEMATMNLLARSHQCGESCEPSRRKERNVMIKVSIVDDEKELCQSIATFVNGAPGFRCVSMYHSGETALEHLPTDQPDVVLMDIHMTGMSGIECVERLKAKMPQMHIMMLTVYEDTDQIFRALSAGASGYMLKRLTPRKLLEAITGCA